MTSVFKLQEYVTHLRVLA